MRVRLTKISILSSKKMLDKKREQKLKNTKTSQTSPFLGFTEKSSTLPCVTWAEESKNDLGFEIGPSYDDVPTRSLLLTDRQSSCSTLVLTSILPISSRLAEKAGVSAAGGAALMLMIVWPLQARQMSRIWKPVTAREEEEGPSNGRWPRRGTGQQLAAWERMSGCTGQVRNWGGIGASHILGWPFFGWNSRHVIFFKFSQI